MKKLATALTGTLLLALTLSPARSAEQPVRAQAASARLEHVKATLLGSPIYDEQLSRIGVIDDVVATDRSQLYAIVRADNALPSGSLDLTIPIRKVQSRSGLLVLPRGVRAAPPAAAPPAAALQVPANASP